MKSFRAVYMLICTIHCLDPLQCLHSRVLQKHGGTSEVALTGRDVWVVRGWGQVRDQVPGQVPGWCRTSDKGQTNQKFQLAG